MSDIEARDFAIIYYGDCVKAQCTFSLKVNNKTNTGGMVFGVGRSEMDALTSVADQMMRLGVDINGVVWQKFTIDNVKMDRILLDTNTTGNVDYWWNVLSMNEKQQLLGQLCYVTRPVSTRQQPKSLSSDAHERKDRRKEMEPVY